MNQAFDTHDAFEQLLFGGFGSVAISAKCL
jgi:hypothetical protein